MVLVTSSDILDRFIPNVLSAVKGEKSLFDKLSPFLDLAEEWVKDRFMPESTFNTIAGYSDLNIIKPYTIKVVVAHAFMNAVPSLDLVLTPNGFGIVNTTNIVPASKERIERLIASLEQERDNAANLLLKALPEESGWLASKHFEFFASTMFPNLDLLDFMGVNEHRLQSYWELRGQLIDIESLIAEQFLSEQLMTALRKELITPSQSSLLRNAVIRSLRAIEVQMLKAILSATAHHGSPPSTLIHLVNTIRQHQEEFPEWHSSPVAELYRPTIYENKKSDKGYWF